MVGQTCAYSSAQQTRCSRELPSSSLALVTAPDARSRMKSAQHCRPQGFRSKPVPGLQGLLI